MKIIKKFEAKAFRAGDSCVVYEYPMDYKDINGAVAKVAGRYPKTGAAVNEECRELGYVMKGSGRVVINKEETLLQEGDLVCIDPGEKFYWEGNLELFIPCSPAWNEKQHKFID